MRRRKTENGARIAAGRCFKQKTKRRLKSSTVILANGVTASHVHLVVRRNLNDETVAMNVSASLTANLVRKPASHSSQEKALRNLARKERRSRVAEVREMSDVHVEMASDLLVNLTDRKTGIVRFEEKRTNR